MAPSAAEASARGRFALRTATLRRALERVGLPAWFVAVDLLWIIKPLVLGVDARHYQRAANAWLSGGNPWTVTEFGINYASGPHTLAWYAPTSVLPVAVSTALWTGIGLVASIWLVRRLGLPVWWILFPPLFHAIWNGNPQTVMVALLVAGTAWGAALAVTLKLYALMTLAFRPRQLVIAGILLAVTLVVLPWAAYLDEGFGVSAHLGTAWNGSAWRFPILIPPTAIALWVLRRDHAQWFAVPALWPATQFYYVATALPAVTGNRVVAALAAAPVPLMIPVLVMALAARRVWQGRAGRPGVPAPARGQVGTRDGSA